MPAVQPIYHPNDRQHYPVPVTRDDFAAIMLRYLEPLKSHFSEGKARLRLGGFSAVYPDEAAELESWARPLWGLGPFWAGGGHCEWLEDTYRTGLINGTDPRHPEYWGAPGPHDQRSVEVPAVAYAIMLAPHILWNPLTPAQREQVAAWLNLVNRPEAACPDNNWLFFPVIVNVALKRLGMPYSGELIRRNLERLDSFYAGGGWYHDGINTNGSYDYYNPYAFHFYGPLFALYAADEYPSLATVFLERAKTFAPTFVNLFSDRGESVPYGRSLTYRFAQCAFFSFAAGHKLDLGSQFTPGVLKGIVARNLAFWAGLPTCDNGGVLTVGYHYPTLFESEEYNAPGSPLWSMKAFALLCLPADDPFWALPNEPLPCEDGLYSVTPGGELVVQRHHGEATLYVCGHQPAGANPHYAPKYAKLCYSTQYGFSMSRSERTLADAGTDSVLAFVINDGRDADGMNVRVVTRGFIAKDAFAWDGSVLTCTWSPCRGINVKTRITPSADGNGHRRKHVIHSDIACVAYDCGFAVPSDRRAGEDDNAWRARIDGMCSVRAVQAPVGSQADLFPLRPNLNLMAPHAVVPAVKVPIEPGTTTIVTEVSEGPINR